MSIATERLSVEDRRIIAESLLTEPRAYKSVEIGAHCPFHQESTPGGAFFYNFEEDVAHCHSCSAGADLVGIYNTVNGRKTDDSDGCSEFIQKYCPDNGQRRTLPQPTKQRPQQRKGWTPGKVTLPPVLWSERAKSFVDHSVERLQSSEKHLTELRNWGISAETAKKCLIGWNDRDKYPPFPSWGLPDQKKDDGRTQKIWLPEGLVIPAVHDGKVVKIKIRRSNPSVPWDTKTQLRYLEVKGGANQLFHIYGHPSFRFWVLVETERDAALVWQSCHDLRIGAMGIGGAAKRPSGHIAKTLERADLILNALDYDKAGGTNTYSFWEKEFPNSLRWPAPPSMGGDVGEAIGKGLNVRQWIWEGIPNYLKKKMRTQMPIVQNPADRLFPGRGLEYAMKIMAKQMPEWIPVLQSFLHDVVNKGFVLYQDDGGWPWVYLTPGTPMTSKIKGSLIELNNRIFSKQKHGKIEGTLSELLRHYYGDILEERQWENLT